jgi:hypothetical protein
MLGDFNLDILINSGQSLTTRYREILDSFSMSPFPVPPFNNKTGLWNVFGSCHVLTKFSDKVVSFGVRLSRASSDHCFFYLFIIVLNHLRHWIGLSPLRM